MTKQTTMNTKILKASQPASPTVPEAAFTQEETARLTAGLMALMQAQLRQKTQGDSTSLRVEDATELMESIRFTLMLHLEKHALPNRALLGDDLPALFKQAQQTLFTVTDETRQLYALALQTINPLGSISLRDTLSHIGAFFARYDARLYAHQIPADIDYQLNQPVAETLRGVLYIREYLTRLLVENELVTRMDAARVVRLLRRLSTDYKSLLINLYEPVAANVVGLSLLGGGETLLEMTPAQGSAARGLLMACPRAQAEDLLMQAATDACRRLGLSVACEQYLRRAAVALYPRLAASAQSIQGVFVL